MLARATAAAVVAALCLLAGANAGSWTPRSFPNPGNNPGACGRGGVATGYSRICDPDSVLSSGSRDVVEGIIQDIEAGRAPYAPMICAGTTTGYKVGVAVLQRMKVSPAEDPEDVAAGFARYLHDSWGVGDRGCNNGVLLLVALQNRQVYISTGAGAVSALPDSQVQAILEKMKSPLRAGDYDHAVEQAAVDIGLVLAGHGFKEDNSGAWIFGGFVAIFASLAGWSCFKGRQQRREYLTCKALLDKLKREQETTLRTRQYQSSSCPICMDDFAPDRASGGKASGEAGPSKASRKPSKEGEPCYHEGSDWEMVEPSAPLLPDSLREAAGEAGPSSSAPGASPAAPSLPRGGSSSGGAGAGEGGKKALVLPCGHRFCHECITQWVETASNSNCPVCRKSIREEGTTDDPVNRGPLPSNPRQQYDPYNDMFVPEAQFRLARLHARYPYYVDSGMVDNWGNDIQQGQVLNMESLRQSQMSSSAHSVHRASGSVGASASFGGGSSFGGGGGGSSW